MDSSAKRQSKTTLGPSPMEMRLLDIGGCKVYTVVDALKKIRLPVVDEVVELATIHANKLSEVCTKTHASLWVTGDVPLKRAEETVTFSADKYCSARRMLVGTTEIAHEVRVLAGKR